MDYFEDYFGDYFGSFFGNSGFVGSLGNSETLRKDTWTKVLTNKTFNGNVYKIDLDEEPTGYFVTLVDTGDPAPSINFEGGIKFSYGFKASNSVPSDFYVKTLNYDGKVVILV